MNILRGSCKKKCKKEFNSEESSGGCTMGNWTSRRDVEHLAHH